MEGVKSWIAGMQKYEPAPQNLTGLTPVQRYFQKRSLDWSDYGGLVILIAIYWFLRPHIQKVAKRWSDEAQGDKATEEYKQRREDAAVANSIRSGKSEPKSKTLGDMLDGGIEGLNNSASATAAEMNKEDAGLKKRKQQKAKKGVSFAEEKSAVEKTLDWEDDSEFDPIAKAVPTEGAQPERNDIKAWMEKWTAE